MSWKDLFSGFAKKPPPPEPEEIKKPEEPPPPPAPPEEAEIHYQLISPCIEAVTLRAKILNQIRDNLFAQKAREILLIRQLDTVENSLMSQHKKIKRLFHVPEDQFDDYEIILPEESNGKPGKLSRKKK